MKHVKCFKKDYPRPQFVRDEWTNLNGIWDFSFDDNNCGEENKWYNDFPKTNEIKVPFTYQTKMSLIHDETAHQNVWYKKEVSFTKKQLDKQVILHFEGCDYVTKLWVNGQFIGEHVGGYERFSFNITNGLKEGANTVVVKAEDSYDCCQPRGKQRWMDHNFGCWYIDTTGIWKTVWVELIDNYHIQDIRITPIYEKQQVQFDYTIPHLTKGLSLETTISYQGELVNRTEVLITRSNFTQISDATTDSEQFKMYTWSSANPNLYDVEFRLKRNKEVIDQVGSYFGFRKLDIDQKSINLNDESLYLKMLLDQGYWPESGLTPPSEDDLITDIMKTIEMGFNGIRKHQKIEDDRFYYYCDILGVYVWLEMPSTYEYRDHALLNFTQEWLEIVKQHVNHPSIITWVPFNESWGVPRIKSDVKQQQFTEGIYHLTKALDQERFVISNDGWEHTKSDIITLHNYAEWGNDLSASYENLNRVLVNNLITNPAPRHAFADGYKYEGQPIMISEYAGIAFQNNDDQGWGYGNKVKDEQEFLDRLGGLTQVIKNLKDVCGYCVTQTTDVEQEINGLLTANRKPKVDIHEIKKINSYKTNSF